MGFNALTVPRNQAKTRPRSLRQILFASLALVLLALTGAQFFVTGALTERQLLDIESENAFARLHKLHRAMDFLAEDLNATATDWAQWDQMHRFASGTYPEFPEYNLIPVTYTGLRLDLVGIVDAKGRVVFAKVLSPDRKTLLDAPADFTAMTTAGGALYAASVDKTTTGLIETTAGIFMVSVQPVRSYYGVPLANTRLVMGRSFARFVEPSLERVTGETLDHRTRDHTLSRARQFKHSQDGDVLRLAHGKLEGVTDLTDIWGQTVARLHLHAERPTEKLVDAARRRLLIAALIMGALFCVAAFFTVRRQVVDPLERLSNAVERMGECSGADARVPLESGSHELATLSAAINTMVDQRDEHQEMRRDRDAAIEANRLKSEFLAIMSHEIRTPMNGVLGMCELLQRTQLDPRQRRMSNTILNSAQSLLQILNDILDFSKIEAGRLELETAAFAPEELLQGVAAPYMAIAHAKQLTLNVVVARSVPTSLMGDEMRLRQILSNLLSNAVKFTERGSVTASCDIAASTEREVTLCFTIADTGIGIPTDVQDHIFDAFAQADSGTSRRFGGTGLGLAIVRRLATLMKGEVRVVSGTGQGSTFTLTLPLQRAPIAKPVATAALDRLGHAKPTRNVLLAEDNAVNREVLKEMLEYEGARVTLAENGAEALQHATHEQFDIIFMDCHMPVMDGLTAVAELREAEQAAGRKPTFVVALTADVTPENRERCREVGMNELAGKPITQQRLGELMRAAA